MSPSFEDTAEIKISTEALKNMTKEQWVCSPERYIRGSKGIRWALHLTQGDDFRYLYLWVSKGGVTATGTIVVGPADTHEFPISAVINCTQTKVLICNGFQSRRLGENGTVTVKVVFTDFEKGYNSQALTVFELITASSHCTADARIQVDDKEIEVHRHILCMVSPVFQAAFTHDTKEAKTGIIKITDFDFATVKNVVDYCCGREIEPETFGEVIDMLMFADKYDIKVVIAKFEPLLDDHIRRRQ